MNLNEVINVISCNESHSGVFTFNTAHNIPKLKCCGQTRHHPNSFNKDENTINTVSRKLEVIFIKAWRGAAGITVRQCRAWLAIPFVFSASRQVLCSPSTVCFSPCLPPNKALFLGHFSLSISETSASLCYACIFDLRLKLFEIPHSLLTIKCYFAVLSGRGSTAIEREPTLCFGGVKIFLFFVFFSSLPFQTENSTFKHRHKTQNNKGKPPQMLLGNNYTAAVPLKLLRAEQSLEPLLFLHSRFSSFCSSL